MSESILGWHFTSNGFLRDKRPIPAIGETLVHDGELDLYFSGLHASERLIDSLKYRPYEALELHRVKLGGTILRDKYNNDKVVASERTILATLNYGHKLIYNYLFNYAKELLEEELPDVPKGLIRAIKEKDNTYTKTEEFKTYRENLSANRPDFDYGNLLFLKIFLVIGGMNEKDFTRYNMIPSIVFTIIGAESFKEKKDFESSIAAEEQTNRYYSFSVKLEEIILKEMGL